MPSVAPAPEFTHERVTTITGRRSGLVMTVALHSNALGPALGGCRLWTYDHWTDSVNDALRLSAAMTLKNAVAGLNTGGGKSVINLPPGTVLTPDARRAAFLDMGDLVETFDGRYRTAEDVGTTAHDMQVVGERTKHVVGLPSSVGGSGEPAGPTAAGVYSAIRTTLNEVAGSPDIHSRRITVSGLGQVGSRLARRLAGEGALLTVSDVNQSKRQFANEIGATWVEAGEAHRVEADLFVPAGIGGVLTEPVIAQLAARAVVGPANNPLAEARGATQLAARGILYAPDFVVNAGGVIYLTLMAEPNPLESEIAARVDNIGSTLAAVFTKAADLDVTPLRAAEMLADERLGAARRQSAKL